MNTRIEWMTASAEPPKWNADGCDGEKKKVETLHKLQSGAEVPIEDLPAHGFPGKELGRVTKEENRNPGQSARYPASLELVDEWHEQDRERRIYRGRTVAMLRRYMRYSIEAGRLPALLGREFFRSHVTHYRVTTFEERVIFVHDMETCLRRLDKFSQEVLSRIVLQEYGHEEAARLLGCTRMTVHRKLVEALDRLVEILLEVRLLDLISSSNEKSCQGGKEAELLLSSYEDKK